MLQTEFEERFGKRITPKEYAAIERVYMAADGVDKDTFCKEWKKLQGSQVVTALTKEVERLEIKKQNLEHDSEMRREQEAERLSRMTELEKELQELRAERTQLRNQRKALATVLLNHGIDDECADIIGSGAVVALKAEAAIPFNQTDLLFIIEQHSL